MATRFALIVIAVLFLSTGFFYSLYLVFDYFGKEKEEPKTNQQTNQEYLDNLEDWGLLENFEPLTEPLTATIFEVVSKGQGDLVVLETDVLTLRLTYALAKTGQIFQNNLTQVSPGNRYQTYTAGFQALPETWQRYLLGSKIGSQYRLMIPAAEADLYLEQAPQLPSNHDFILELDLVGIADRNLKGFVELESLENFEPISQALTELQIEDLIEGTGQVVQAGDRVVVNYILAHATDGNKIEATNAISLNLEQLIEGWQTGLLDMKVGGKRRILIPDSQAYGSIENHSLKGFDLVFDVELLGIIELEEQTDKEEDV